MVNTDYKQLGFFNKSHDFTLEIYNITKKFPKDELYCLVSQLKRAACSIPSNIAEGSVRSTIKDYKSYLHNALGSAKEIEYQLLLAKDLKYIPLDKYEELIKKLNEIIGSLTNYMKRIDN
mgnify:CR=1 FL=1